MPKLNFKNQIKQYCTKAVVETVKVPISMGDSTLDLERIFDVEIGKSRWPRIMRRQVDVVHKKVAKDVKAGVVDPMESEKPIRFIINSVAIHVLEKLLVKAGIGTLAELREGGYHEALHNRVSELELQ